MNTPALSNNNSPATSFSSMASPPAQFFSASPSPWAGCPSTFGLSNVLIDRAAFDVIEILSIHCMHMGGARNARLVSEGAWVAATAIHCERDMQICYYYEIQRQVELLVLSQHGRVDVPHPPSTSASPRSGHPQSQCTTTKEQRIVCPDCSRSFSRSDSLIRHRRKSCTYPKNTQKPSKSSRHIKHVFSIRPY